MKNNESNLAEQVVSLKRQLAEAQAKLKTAEKALEELCKDMEEADEKLGWQTDSLYDAQEALKQIKESE